MFPIFPITVDKIRHLIMGCTVPPGSPQLQALRSQLTADSVAARQHLEHKMQLIREHGLRWVANVSTDSQLESGGSDLRNVRELFNDLQLWLRQNTESEGLLGPQVIFLGDSCRYLQKQLQKIDPDGKMGCVSVGTRSDPTLLFLHRAPKDMHELAECFARGFAP
jgi:hypothetical protein